MILDSMIVPVDLIVDLIAVTILSVAPIVVLIGVMKASAAPMMTTVDVIAAVMTEREVLAVGATTFRVNILEYAQVPRARAAMAGRGNVERRQSVPSRNALITLDADVARVFGTSEAVNAALRHLITLAGIMGEEAIKQAAIESQKEPQVDSVEEKEELQAEAKDNVDAIQTTEDDEEEEWFDLPVEGEKTE